MVESSLAAPRIECDEPKYDFGTVIGQEKITHDFVLWNRGDEPLEIVKIKDCCGVKSTVEPMTIPPGSNAVCTSVFTTQTRYGCQNKQILLSTNDKKNRYINLWMTGTLLKPVEFTPRFIRLDDLLPDSEVSETITATNLLSQIVTLESVSTTIKGLEAKIVDIRDHGSRLQDKASAGGSVDPARSWTIRVKSTQPLTVGDINGQVELNFPTGSVTVPVVGKVKPIIQVVPDRIQFSSGSTNTVDRLIMLRSSGDRPFEILSVAMKNADGSVETQKLAEGKWQVQLSIQPDSIKPDSAVIIKTTIESQNTITISMVMK